MLHQNVSINYPWLPHNVDPANNPTPDEYRDMPLQPLGDKQAAFNQYLNGCVEHYGEKKGERCISNEAQRIKMTLRQPKGMKNYTSMGFKKMRAPDHVFSLLKTFWEANKDSERDEKWPAGNIYVNHCMYHASMRTCD